MDAVNHPKHYTSHPSGVETIQITEHMGFCLGNVIKYVMRADHKGNRLQDLEKAAWYLNREIERERANLSLRMSEEPRDKGSKSQHDGRTKGTVRGL